MTTTRLVCTICGTAIDRRSAPDKAAGWHETCAYRLRQGRCPRCDEGLGRSGAREDDFGLFCAACGWKEYSA